MGYCKRCGEYFPTLTNSVDLCPRCACGLNESHTMTIADHIRAMEDEELAEYLAKMLADYTKGLYGGEYIPSDKVVSELADMLLEALQQPYESEGTP